MFVNVWVWHSFIILSKGRDQKLPNEIHFVCKLFVCMKYTNKKVHIYF